ncbi:MAG: hypothetical protein H0V29_07230 [Thermoleophilaceae bacterium]|nr:hypothetical protein [Thermoleophilaceae bacterium]
MRPFALLATAGTLAHHAYETRAGVGLVFEPFLGRRGAICLWSVVIPFSAMSAIRGKPERDLALGAGSAAAGVLTHFAVWPWSLHNGIPMLDEAEGLTVDQLPMYNAILWGWLIGALGAIAFETRREHFKWAVLGFATGPGLIASAKHHFAWAAEQAREDPASWSPALLDRDRA